MKCSALCISALLLAVPSACDNHATTPRSGTEVTTADETGDPPDPPAMCPVAWPRVATVSETAHCGCNPKDGDEACPQGTHCVPLQGEEYRCLARMEDNPILCTFSGQERAPFVPAGDDNHLYCSACTACAEPLPKSLLCLELAP